MTTILPFVYDELNASPSNNATAQLPEPFAAIHLPLSPKSLTIPAATVLKCDQSLGNVLKTVVVAIEPEVLEVVEYVIVLSPVTSLTNA